MTLYNRCLSFHICPLYLNSYIFWSTGSNTCRSCGASSGRAGTSTEPGAVSGGGSGRPEEAESSLPVVDGFKVTSVSDTVALAAASGGADW